MGHAAAQMVKPRLFLYATVAILPLGMLVGILTREYVDNRRLEAAIRKRRQQQQAEAAAGPGRTQ